jgi:polysaccharide biosynthesis/export protein
MPCSTRPVAGELDGIRRGEPALDRAARASCYDIFHPSPCFDRSQIMNERPRRRAVLTALTLLPLLAGCASPGSDLPPVPPRQNLSSYRLGPGDTLDIKVLGATELNGRYIVQDDGTIRMLMIGKVPAAGLTSQALAENIAEMLRSGRYITKPFVSVEVTTYRPFYILGEVAKPGAYPYATGMRVLSAVADAQGYTYRANKDFVIITRDGKNGKAGVLASIQPDDIIRVPERYF